MTLLPAATPAAVRRHAALLLAPYRRVLVLLAVVVLVGSAAALGAPLVIGRAVDDVVAGHGASGARVAALVLVGLALTASVLDYVRVRLAAQVTEGVLADLRVRSAEGVLDLAVSDVQGATRGDLVARLTGDVEVLAEALRVGVPVVVRAVALLGIAVVVALVVSPLLALLGGLGLVVMVRAMQRLLRRTSRIYADYRERLGSSLGVLSESVAGVRVIQAYDRGADRAAHYAEHNRGVVASYLSGMRARNRFYPLLIVVQAVSVTAVAAVGSLLALDDRLSVGTVTAAVLAVAAIYRPVEEIADWMDHLQAAGAALARVVTLLDLEPAVHDPDDPVPLPAEGALETRHLGFAYGDAHPVLHDVELTLAPGERVALVGTTGAGKSTFARLVGRLAEPRTGSVLFGGVDLADAAYADVRRHVVVVPQEGHLVAGSIADNVRLAAPDAPDDVVVDAFERIGAGDWLRTLPDGVATDVAAAGSRLSAGERQLVALARVALADPRVVVLDEATSALDLGTERLVEDALGRALAGRAVLVVAHRASTAQRADRVAVLDAGRLVELGPHDDLVAAGGHYAELWSAWDRTA